MPDDPMDELTDEQKEAALINENISWHKEIFQDALGEFTSLDQTINYIAGQPQKIFDETIEKIDEDIALHEKNRDLETARVIELQ
ncbi:unnamed protein product, partial [marine sediment metagenome]